MNCMFRKTFIDYSLIKPNNLICYITILIMQDKSHIIIWRMFFISSKISAFIYKTTKNSF